MDYTHEELEAFLIEHFEVESTKDFKGKADDLYVSYYLAVQSSQTLVEFLDNMTLNQAKILLYGIAAMSMEGR